VLKHPMHASRRRTFLAGCAMAACASLIRASETAATSAAPELKLHLVLSQQVGDRLSSLEIEVVGYQGVPIRMGNSGDGSDASPPMGLEMTSQLIDQGKVQIDAVIGQGHPLAVVARPHLIINPGASGVVRQTEPGTNRRVGPVVAPSLFERH